MVVDNIVDLNFIKGEVFNSKHISIYNDNIYISDDFAKMISSNIDTMFRYAYTNIRISVKLGGINCVLSIFLSKHISGISNTNVWLVCGRCGTHGFNGGEASKRDILGVRTKRKAIKFMVKLYLNSNLCRVEKLMEILK